MRTVIEWTEENHQLKGQILNVGPTIEQLVAELENMPIDLPSLKEKECTQEVLILYPENFAEDRKQEFLEKVKEMYPESEDWKYGYTDGNLSFYMYPPSSENAPMANALN